METIVINPMKKGKISKLKGAKTMKKRKSRKGKIPAGLKRYMAKKKSRKTSSHKKASIGKSAVSTIKKLMTMPMFAKKTKKHKAKAHKGHRKVMSAVSGARRTRPVFYQIGKSTIKRSPKAKVRYATMLNPKMFQKSVKDLTAILPEVLGAGAGYVGLGYVSNLITNMTVDKTTQKSFMDNSPVRQIVKAGATLGLTAVVNMWNKSVGKAVLLGGMLNVLQDIWVSYEIQKLIPINVAPALPASTTATATTATAETTAGAEAGTETLIYDGLDTLITNAGTPIF